MKTMQAIRMDDFGGPDVLRLVEIDQPQPGLGQVLIRVESAAVNFADVMRRRNDLYPFPTVLPFIPGSEVAGTVERLGEGVDGPPPGTPVLAVVGGDGSTGYAQFAVAEAGQVIPVPTGLSSDEAAAMVIAGTTAMLLLSDVARLQPGESVLVGGAGGGVGLLAVQIARSLGAGIVIGSASSSERRSAALAAGADHVVDPGDVGWAGEVRALTGGIGVDVVLEMTGGHVFADGLTTLGPFGRFAVYGMASGVPGVFGEAAQEAFLYRPSLGQSLHVFNLGLYFGLRPDAAIDAMSSLIGLVASGQVKVPVGATLPLSAAAEAHRLIERRQSTGKIVLHPWATSRV